jgi:hypothetical protein
MPSWFLLLRIPLRCMCIEIFINLLGQTMVSCVFTPYCMCNSSRRFGRTAAFIFVVRTHYTLGVKTQRPSFKKQRNAYVNAEHVSCRRLLPPTQDTVFAILQYRTCCEDHINSAIVLKRTSIVKIADWNQGMHDITRCRACCLPVCYPKT